jgi:hypothetical protein
VQRHQLLTKTREALAGCFQSLRVAVQPQEPAPLQAPQDLFRVPAGAERRVDIRAVRSDREVLNRLSKQNRNVRSALTPRLEFQAFSCQRSAVNRDLS